MASGSNQDGEEPRWMTVCKKLYRYNGFLNDIMLIPMFTGIILETRERGNVSFISTNALSSANIGFCVLFFTEWLLGLIISDDRKAFLKSPGRIIDLVSTLPFGDAFQTLRIFRLARLIRLLRVVIRARRYKGKGEKLLRALSIVGATVFAGAIALHTVDPDNPALDSFGDALWWSIVTVSTVGYGDITPMSGQGKLVAVALILFGMGVAGYLAGFMASILAEPDEESVADTLVRMDAKLNRIAAHLDIDVSDLQAPKMEDFEPKEGSS
ncbi:MAG: voltage-gated potassium channel [Myxococcota bacterium]|jgi:voltage-gated potassium channel